MKTHHLTEHLSTPFVDDYDVVVAGGGASGLIAAVSASRAGARTLLLERANCMGGTGTTSMVAQWIGFFNRDRQVVGGIAEELAQRVVQLGGSEGFKRYLMAEASDHPIPLVHFAFNPETVKIACDQIAVAAGISIRLHSKVVAPILDKNRLTGVVVEDAGGRSAVSARMVIDATGDASVAHAAGVELADPEVQSKRDTQPFTLMFRLSNVNVPAFRAIPREQKRALALKGIADKKIYWKASRSAARRATRMPSAS